MEKLKVLQGGNKPNEMRGVLKNIRDNFPEFIEHTQLMAELIKAKYDACIKQGFTPEQALELSKNL